MTSEMGEAERLAIAYAPARLRPVFQAVLGLDGVLGRIALAKGDPLPAQLKLAWWRDACTRLPGARDHPVLRELSAIWRAGPDPLIALVDAWEEVAVAGDGFALAAEAVARQRGVVLALCAGGGEAAACGPARAWTLVTLSGHAPDPAMRQAMRAAARLIPPVRLPRALRPLAVLEGLARRALAAEHCALIGDRWSPLAAMRLGIFGR